MAQASVKKGDRYFYNTANGAVYPWAPELAGRGSLMPFTAPKDGPFDIGMTLAQAQDTAEADRAAAEVAAAEQKAAAEKESLLSRAEHAVVGEVEKLAHQFTTASGRAPEPTLAATDQPEV